ncbi:MAG TPA: TonB-dependent receptor plug domain-containing protein [Gemmatimonadales bacterium]
MLTQTVLATGAIVWLTATAAGAQAVLRGRVLEDSTRVPLSDVEILVQNVPVMRSAATGEFLLHGLPSGVQVILFRRIGFRPVRLRALLTEGDTLDRTKSMERSTVELAPLEVTASSVPPGMERFAERRARGMGTYWDTKLMRASEHRRLAEMLTAVSGIRPLFRGNATFATTRRGGAGISTKGGEPPCYMAVWLDGIQIFAPTSLGGTAPPDLNKFKTYDLEAVEVYPGPATLPQELGGTGGNCGAIVLWSRRR